MSAAALDFLSFAREADARRREREAASRAHLEDADLVEYDDRDGAFEQALERRNWVARNVSSRLWAEHASKLEREDEPAVRVVGGKVLTFRRGIIGPKQIADCMALVSRLARAANGKLQDKLLSPRIARVLLPLLQYTDWKSGLSQPASIARIQALAGYKSRAIVTLALAELVKLGLAERVGSDPVQLRWMFHSEHELRALLKASLGAQASQVIDPPVLSRLDWLGPPSRSDPRGTRSASRLPGPSLATSDAPPVGIARATGRRGEQAQPAQPAEVSRLRREGSDARDRAASAPSAAPPRSTRPERPATRESSPPAGTRERDGSHGGGESTGRASHLRIVEAPSEHPRRDEPQKSDDAGKAPLRATAEQSEGLVSGEAMGRTLESLFTPRDPAAPLIPRSVPPSRWAHDGGAVDASTVAEFAAALDRLRAPPDDR